MGLIHHAALENGLKMRFINSRPRATSGTLPVSSSLHWSCGTHRVVYAGLVQVLTPGVWHLFVCTSATTPGVNLEQIAALSTIPLFHILVHRVRPERYRDAHEHLFYTIINIYDRLIFLPTVRLASIHQSLRLQAAHDYCDWQLICMQRILWGGSGKESKHSCLSADVRN